MIKETTFCGEPAIEATNGVLEATLVPSWGSNLVRLKHLPSGLDILRYPESAEEFRQIPVLYGIPILFPPNRIEDGVFKFEGREYRLDLNEPEDNNHSHGVLFQRPWKLQFAGERDGLVTLETEICSGDDPWIFEQLPHRFRARMAFTLSAGRLIKEITVINESGQSMPCGIGYHTTFRYPLSPEGSVERCRFSLTAGAQWLLNKRFLPTGERVPIPYADELSHGMSLAGRPLDDVFGALNGRTNEAVLEDPDAGLRVSYRTDRNFRFWVVYNDDAKQGYLCPEPYTWVTNAPNLELPESETGFFALKPGDRLSAGCEIAIERL